MPELPCTTTSTPAGSGHTCDADASCSRTSWGVPWVIGRRSMMASRDASASVRCRLASSSPRRPTDAQDSATRTVPAPRIQKLEWSEVALTRIDARTAPPTIAAIELASNSPAMRPSVSRGVTRASTVSATTSQQTSPAPPATVTISASGQHVAARVDELARAREHRRADHDQRQTPAGRQLAVEDRADEPAGA